MCVCVCARARVRVCVCSIDPSVNTHIYKRIHTFASAAASLISPLSLANHSKTPPPGMRTSESRPSDAAQGSADGHGDVVPNGRLGLKEARMKDGGLRGVGVRDVGQSTAGELAVKQLSPRR